MSPLIFLKAVYKGKIIKLFNKGNSLRSFTYITDVVDMIEKSSKNKSFLTNKKKYHKIYNIGNDKNISTFNFLKLIEKNLEKKAKFKKIKNRKADIKNTKANIFLAKKKNLNLNPKLIFRRVSSYCVNGLKIHQIILNNFFFKIKFAIFKSLLLCISK